MNIESILEYYQGLSAAERSSLLSDLERIENAPSPEDAISPCDYRRHLLDNKQGACPHCGHTSYVKFGVDKGAQRYKCKSCKRNFTQYTGTWMAGLHKKEKIEAYLNLMLEQKSLDKIKVELKMNKKTAFDWRHKILSSLRHTDEGPFKGITESDETFFRHSKKGSAVKERKSRKRGGDFHKRGIGEDQIAVVVTLDRQKEMDMSVVGNGRLEKSGIKKAIGTRITDQTILCTDSHVSYKGFAADHKLEHHPLRTDLKQRVKQGVYHIQHVNSAHNRVKKWIDHEFWGVATKYLQQYLNWFRIKEVLKESKNKVRDLAQMSARDISAYNRFRDIQNQYQMIISSQ